MMKMYTTYINEYDGATAVWTKYSAKQEFADYIAVHKRFSWVWLSVRTALAHFPLCFCSGGGV